MVNFQTKESRNVEMNENNLKKLHAQRAFWRGNNKNACVGHFIVLVKTKKLMQ
jgi:hypothetical protein